MSEIVFLLEELSAKAMLAGVMPRLAPGITYHCIVFEGKYDLEKNLTSSINQYRIPSASFIVLRDQDLGDCRAIKQNLIGKCREAGRSEAIVRIVCRELESWYLADLCAVEKGLEVTGLSKHQNKAKFRKPDDVIKPSKVLEKIVPSYDKMDGSKRIGRYLDLTNRRSRSFYHFITAIQQLALKEK